jgi:predicted dienelactone hydrolase
MKQSLCFVGVLALLACQTDPEPEVEDDRGFLGPVTELGPHAVGTVEGQFVDSVGVSIPVQVWYPSADSDGTPVSYDGLYPGESWESAQAVCDTPHPVVMFSHGNTGIRWQSAFLMHFLSSHGFVVAAMDHVTNTFVDQNNSRFPNHVLDRPRHVRESFDWLVAESQTSDALLKGCVDETAGYAVMGHSFGGYTAYVTSGATISVADIQAGCDAGSAGACTILDLWFADHPGTDVIDLSDDRVWAAVTLAPWDAGGVISDGMSDIFAETLTLTGTLDDITPLSMVDGLVQALGDTPSAYGQLVDAGHFSFSPMACQFMSGNGCGEDYLSIDAVKDLTNQSATSFLGSVLDWEGAAEQFPVVSDDLIWD